MAGFSVHIREVGDLGKNFKHSAGGEMLAFPMKILQRDWVSFENVFSIYRSKFVASEKEKDLYHKSALSS